ncbi:glycine betaine ABC transporter substrate-binding protein [Naumannella halotolerans]|uniref:glycine betaine ABC transporter substrate-binding protein n=1 Tax=Naumannella halotolerans TaxID=993414 RepID=UPI00370DBE87
MTKIEISKLAGALGASALLLTVAGCGASNTGGEPVGGGATEEAAESPWANCTPGAESADITSTAPDADSEITIGTFNGWDESVAVAHLTKAVLEEDGYTVNIEAFDAGPGYVALDAGDIDLLVDSWLPLTHEDYLEQYGDNLEAMGCWYDNAKLTIAVNDDSPAQSIADLAEMGDEYGNRLVGIEPGAGLTRITKEEAIPTYGLEGYEFIESSTPAMLAELKSATDSGENIAVTLWRPHWAYGSFPIRDLEDPEGAMGDAELIYNFGTSGFGEAHPKAAQLMKNLVLDDERLSDLESVMFAEDQYNGEDPDGAVAEWLADNPDFVEEWQTGQLAG